MRFSSKGVKKTIETVYNKSDRYYHLMAGHADVLSNEHGIAEVVATLKNPASIYKEADAHGNVGKMYIEKENDNDSLIVITRDEINYGV